MIAIRAAGLAKSYSGNPVLRDVNLDIAAGSVVAFLGPNGAGKTSLVEILEGHRMRSEGSLKVLGLDPGDRRDFRILRQRMGVVLQQTMLEPGISCRDLLRRQASYYANHVPVAEMLDQVELSEKANDVVRTLSGGLRRRLDIALALIGRPEILFLDEPTTGLDPLSRRTIRQLVRDVNAAGTTVILTSHDLDEVQDLATTVHVLSQGAFIASGSPHQIISASSSATFIRFLVEGVDVSSLPDGASVQGDMIQYETREQDHVMAQLQHWSTANGHPLHGLTIIQPNLEDAYASLLTDKTSTGVVR